MNKHTGTAELNATGSAQLLRTIRQQHWTRRSTLAAALTLGLVGCVPPTESPDATGGGDGDAAAGTALTCWGWREDEAWVGLMEQYNATEPEVKVEYRGYRADEYNSVLQTGLSGNSGPDLMMLRSYGGMETVVAGGGIAPVEDGVPELADFDEVGLAGARSVDDGKVYGIPFATVTGHVIYNAGLFAEHGLNEPQTWDEFIELNDALTEQGISPLAVGALDSWALPIVRDIMGASGYGGPDLQQGILNGETNFLDEGYTTANQTLHDLSKYFPEGFEGLSYADAQALFISGQSAMFPAGLWQLAEFRAQAPDLEYGIFDVPRIDGSTEDPYTMGYVDGSIGMSSRLEGGQREAALAFLRWVAGEDFGRGVANDLSSVPAAPGIEPEDELMAKAISGYEGNPTPYLTYVSFDYGTPSGTQLEYDNIQRMLLGEIDAASVGQAVHDGIDQWFEPTE